MLKEKLDLKLDFTPRRAQSASAIERASRSSHSPKSPSNTLDTKSEKVRTRSYNVMLVMSFQPFPDINYALCVQQQITFVNTCIFEIKELKNVNYS